MAHPDCSCCTSYPCEKAPDIFSNCWGFSLADGMVAIAPHDWRPDWSKATPEGLEALRVADARQGLPECNARWEEAVLSATGDSVYRSNEFEL